MVKLCLFFIVFGRELLLSKSAVPLGNIGLRAWGNNNNKGILFKR